MTYNYKVEVDVGDSHWYRESKLVVATYSGNSRSSGSQWYLRLLVTGCNLHLMYILMYVQARDLMRLVNEGLIICNTCYDELTTYHAGMSSRQ